MFSNRLQEFRKFVLEKTIVEKNYFIILIGNVISAVLAFTLNTAYARIFSPSEFGLFYTLVAISYLLVALSDLGNYKSAVHYCNININESDIILNSWLIIRLVSFCFISLIFLLVTSYYPGYVGIPKLDFNRYSLILFCSLSIIMAGYAMVVSNAKKLFSMYNFQKIMNPVSRLVLLYATILLFGNFTVNNALFHLGISFIFIILPIIYLKYIKYIKILDWEWISNILSFGKWLYFAGLLQAILSRMDIFIISNYKGLEDVGKYSIALMILTAIELTLEPIGVVLLPNVAGYRKEEQYRGLVNKSIYLFFATIIPVIVITPFIDAITSLVFGNKYISSSYIIQIIIFKFPVHALLVPFTLMAFPMGKLKIIVQGYILYIIINISLGIFLTVRFGANGMAASSMISSVSMAAFIILYVKRELNLMFIKAENV